MTLFLPVLYLHKKSLHEMGLNPCLSVPVELLKGVKFLRFGIFYSWILQTQTFLEISQNTLIKIDNFRNLVILDSCWGHLYFVICKRINLQLSRRSASFTGGLCSNATLLNDHFQLFWILGLIFDNFKLFGKNHTWFLQILTRILSLWLWQVQNKVTNRTHSILKESWAFFYMSYDKPWSLSPTKCSQSAGLTVIFN